MDRTELDRIVSERYSNNADHQRQQVAALRRIAESIKANGGKDAHGNSWKTFAAAADKAEARIATL